MKIKDGYSLFSLTSKDNAIVNFKNGVDMGKMITINEVGSFIFDLITKGHDQKEILSQILSNFDTTEEEASKDLESFISKLRELEILED